MFIWQIMKQEFNFCVERLHPADILRATTRKSRVPREGQVRSLQIGKVKSLVIYHLTFLIWSLLLFDLTAVPTMWSLGQ
jgi:hypothetical protein